MENSPQFQRSMRRTSQGSASSSLQRNRSSYAYDKVIDTPLHEACENLILLRHFFDRIDPSVIRKTLEDLRNEGLPFFSVPTSPSRSTNLGDEKTRSKSWHSSISSVSSNGSKTPSTLKSGEDDFDEFAFYSPGESIDQVLEALLDPEHLMTPVLRRDSDNDQADGWLSELGSNNHNFQSQMLKERRTSRFSSDELSSIVATNNGILIRSKSVANMTAIGEHPSLPEPSPDFVDIWIYQNIECWNFDIFKFEQETGGRPLYALLWVVFSKHNYFEDFNICRTKFKRFAKEVENGYLSNPYHNSSHAADVVLSAHHLLYDLDLGENLSSLDLFSSIIACAIHDMRHPGRTNAFLIKSRHRLSMLYNDQSVLEQFHVAEAFSLLSNPEMDILECFSETEWETFRRITIKSVLATDLKEHFETVARLQNFKSNKERFMDRANQDFILSVVIKIADIGHSGKDFELHREWAR